jgi:hypothetical protein
MASPPPLRLVSCLFSAVSAADKWLEWLWNFAVSKATPLMVLALNNGKLFFFFFATNMAAFVFVCFIPETKGLSLESMVSCSNCLGRLLTVCRTSFSGPSPRRSVLQRSSLATATSRRWAVPLVAQLTLKAWRVRRIWVFTMSNFASSWRINIVIMVAVCSALSDNQDACGLGPK